MAPHGSSIRRSLLAMATALAGASVPTGCGGPAPGGERATAPTASTAGSTGRQPDSGAATADRASAGHTVEQVRSAVASVDSPGSPLQLSVRELSDPGRWDTTVDPGACEEAWRSGDEFRRQHVGTPVVVATGDAERLQVRATVFDDEQTAASAAAVNARLLGEDCGQYTISGGRSGVPRRLTNDTFPVQLPDGAEAVTAVTSETVSTDPTSDRDRRHSQVQAVLDNVLVVAEYGVPVRDDGSAAPDAVPLQAERAAAERAARQVLVELTGPS